MIVGAPLTCRPTLVPPLVPAAGLLAGLLAALLAACGDLPTGVGSDPPSLFTAGVGLYGYSVVAEHPHDPEAFTQGLVLDRGALFESSISANHARPAGPAPAVHRATGRIGPAATKGPETPGAGARLSTGHPPSNGFPRSGTDR